MNDPRTKGLSWLPKPPQDFSERCRRATKQGSGQDLAALAAFRLDEAALRHLARALEAARASGADLSPLRPLRLGFLSNATLDLLAPAVVASAARHGFVLELVKAPYNQVAQQALGPDSIFTDQSFDAVLVALDQRGLPLDCALGDTQSASDAVEKSLDYLASIRAGIHRHSGAPCVVQTIPRPPEPLFGSADLQIAGTSRWAIDAFNRGLADRLRGHQDILFDVAALAESVGLDEWHDAVQWHVAKLPFAQHLAPLYGEALARLMASLRGRSRRCLVLDLDNTLWGGVVGDDGLAGIRLGQGDPVGEAFLSVQQMALNLRERGIVLAVCSKNDDATARLPFRKHPEMLLREEHFAVFQANWTDKASNLKAIARALNLGTDALVFVDDNPAERALVRDALPEVAVPELPVDPALIPRTVLSAGYFEATTLSPEDRRRAAFYESNAKRAAVLERVGNVDEYLKTLAMVVTFAPFDELGRSRIAQLVNKSNQFNLTTRRYNEKDVQNFQEDPTIFTLQVRVEDRFGDNGMISVVICRDVGDAWEIDTWLMSCRVVGRRIEEAVLAEIARNAQASGRTTLRGRYLATARNGLVKKHYEKLGFTMKRDCDGQESEWEVDVRSLRKATLPMEIRRLGI